MRTLERPADDESVESTSSIPTSPPLYIASFEGYIRRLVSHPIDSRCLEYSIPRRASTKPRNIDGNESSSINDRVLFELIEAPDWHTFMRAPCWVPPRSASCEPRIMDGVSGDR